MKALFDTNILIDYLQGIEKAKIEIELYEKRFISIITRMEVLIGTPTIYMKDTEGFLNNFTMIELNKEVAEIAIKLHKKTRIKLPDAIIWATAKHVSSILVTRNAKDFSSQAADIKIPYYL